METVRTRAELNRLQSLSLDEKIEIAEARILEFYHKMNGKVYISFSGGKDSTVLLHLVRNILPNIEAVFCDTGLEFPEIKDFAKSFDNVTVIRPKMSFRQVLDKYGYPVISKEVSEAISRLKKNPESEAALQRFPIDKGLSGRYNYARWRFLVDAPFDVSGECCNQLKKQPFREFKKLTGKSPIIGTTCAESLLREQRWIIDGCNIFTSGNEKSRPMSVWTEVDIYEYIERFGLEIASVYTHGRQRTGCIFCAFGAHLEREPNRFQLLAKTHPQLYEYCMKPKEQGGLGMATVLEYIGIKYVNDKVIKKRVIIRDKDRAAFEEQLKKDEEAR